MTDLIKRINELANKSKIVGLTDIEKEEQDKLRKEYIAAFRGNMKDILLNIKVVDEEGNDCTPEKLKQEKRRTEI